MFLGSLSRSGSEVCLRNVEISRRESCSWWPAFFPHKNCKSQGKFVPGWGRSDQIRSVTQSCPTLCDPMNRSTPGLRPSPTPGVQRLTSIESVMPSSHLILCRPLLLLTPIPPSIRVFSNESTLRMRWPKDWSFSFSLPMNIQD